MGREWNRVQKEKCETQEVPLGTSRRLAYKLPPFQAKHEAKVGFNSAQGGESRKLIKPHYTDDCLQLTWRLVCRLDSLGVVVYCC